VDATTRDAVADALAMVEARLRGDDEALRVITAHAGLPMVARVLAEMMARLLAAEFPEDTLAVVPICAPRGPVRGDVPPGAPVQ